MNKAMEIGRSGLNSMSQHMNRISQNLANTDTTGYKRSDSTFGQLVRNAMITDSPAVSEEAPPDRVMEGSGVRNLRNLTDFSQGSIEKGGERLHLAIDGEGFFGVETPDGQLLLTRRGDFKQSPTGRIVDGHGNGLDIVTEQGQSIEDYANHKLEVRPDGTVWALDEQNDEIMLGSVNLYSVPDTNLLVSASGGYYTVQEEEALTTSGENPEIFGTIKTESLERSNVDMLQEMTDMIMAQRTFQLNSKSVVAADETMSIFNNLLG